MQALVVSFENGNLKPNLENLIPPICKDNEVLIEVSKTGICGSDFHLFSKKGFSGAQTFPQIIGHEFSGRIVHMGNCVTGFCIGDYVASESVVTCGKCKECNILNEYNCNNADLIGFTKPGAFAEYICIDFHHVHTINSLIEKYGKEKGLLLGTILEPLGCAFKSIFLVNKNHDFDNKNFIIFGAGPIGLGAVWLLSTMTSANIFLVDEVASRLERARNMRCKTICEHISEEFINSGKLPKADFLFETSGVSVDLDCIVPALFNSNATMIYIARNGVKIRASMDTFVSNDFTLIGSRGHRKSFPSLIKIMLNVKIDNLLDIVESKQISLNDLPQVLVDSENLYKGKIIVNIKS